jgi:thermostable 8-oxoguanine DNA glycosylase
VSDDDVWNLVLGQVSVVGSAASGERLLSSKTAMSALRYRRLVRLNAAARTREIHRKLRAHGVRYVTRRPANCAKTRALVRNLAFLENSPGGPSCYIRQLAALPSEEDRIARVSKDLAFIKLKGSRDFLAELGLATNVIAFDVRVLGILRAVGMKLVPNTTSSRKSYERLQALLLREVCAPEGVTGVVLDRILFWNAAEIRLANERGEL